MKKIQNISKEEIDTQLVKPQPVTFRYSAVFALAALILGFSSGVFIMSTEIKKIQQGQSGTELEYRTERNKRIPQK